MCPAAAGKLTQVSGDSAFTVRPMRRADIPVVFEHTTEGTHRDLDPPGPMARPTPALLTDRGAELWGRRTEHLLEHDPAGCWVAEGSSGLLGWALSFRRDLAWILSAFRVRAGGRGEDVAQQLLEAALSYGAGCLRAMASAPSDPTAVRRYRLAGFTLHPMMELTGTVDRSLLPVVERVRAGTAGDIDLMNSVDRQVRETAHGVDHELLTRMYRLVVVDRSTGSGYAYIADDGSPYLLAATNRRTATDLLWESLAGSTPARPCRISHVTATNEWAVDVGMAAQLPLSTRGYLALRHMRPPMPYLPSREFL
jgi:GNAT superfamily N-acetyltransferase